MGALPGWMPVLMDRVNWGASTSPWFIDLADEAIVLERGKKILFALWPFVRELPQNIRNVRAKLPPGMTAANQLLDQLGDDELQYRQIFLNQFPLGGVTAEEVNAADVSEVTQNLCDVMYEMCTNRGYADGIHAIVAAELSATAYCRKSAPLYETYFEKHADRYELKLINEGMEWVRLHAKTNMRHAIWMKRMIDDLNETGDQIPAAAEAVLNATLALWECPVESSVSFASN